jgi:hypothetical protein
MITSPNQEQLLSLLRTALQMIGTYLLARGTLGADGANLWQLISGLIMMIAPTVWSMFAHTESAQIKNVTAMDDVAKVIKADDAPADSAIAKLAADPAQPKVVATTKAT